MILCARREASAAVAISVRVVRHSIAQMHMICLYFIDTIVNNGAAPKSCNLMVENASERVRNVD